MKFDDLIEPLTRLAATADAIEGLRELFGEVPLDDVAARVAATAAAAIGHADAVCITVLTWPNPRHAAWTDERALELDKQQCATGRGPCLEAASLRMPIRAEIGADRHLWPEFIDAAKQLGIRASLSVPLHLGGLDEEQERGGALNIYSHTESAFDEFDAELMHLYTAAAAQAITNAGRWQRSRENVARLEHAVRSRGTIDMAKGVLMARNGCGPNQALATMMEESQRHNIKLLEVARGLLTNPLIDFPTVSHEVGE